MAPPPRPKVNWNVVKSIADTFELSMDGASDLYRQLLDVRQEFALRCYGAWREKASTDARLKRIASVVSCLSRALDVEGRQQELILNRMGQAGERWASK